MGKKEQNNKKKMNTDIKIFLAVSAIVVLGFAILLIYLSKPKVVTVATIDKNSVNSNEFQYYLSQNIANILQYKTDYTMDNSTFLNSSYGSGTVMDAVKQQTLGQAIQVELLLQKAKEDGFKVSGKELEDAWKNFESTMQQNADYYEMSLKEFCKEAMGVSLGTAEKIFKEYFTSQKYFEAKADEIAVDEAQLTAYYEENKDSFDHATVRHILITCEEGADEPTIAEKKKLAEDILAKVNNGEDFSALAKEYSEDDGSKDSGGVYDIQPNGKTVPEFEDWTFSHAAGDTGVVQSTYGFHVMKLDSISNTFESQMDDVEQAYKTNEYQKTLDDALSSDEYTIDVKDAYYSITG